MNHTHNINHGHGHNIQAYYPVEVGGDHKPGGDTDWEFCSWYPCLMGGGVYDFTGDSGYTRDYTDNTGITESRPNNYTYVVWKRIS